MNKHWMIRLIAASLLLSASAQGVAAGLYVICNPSLAVTADAIKGIFLGDTQFAGSAKLEPADNSAAQAAFLSKVISMDKEKYDAAWVKKSFRDGLSQPPLRGSDAEVIDFVKKTPGGISYVITAPPADVKVVQSY